MSSTGKSFVSQMPLDDLLLTPPFTNNPNFLGCPNHLFGYSGPPRYHQIYAPISPHVFLNPVRVEIPARLVEIETPFRQTVADRSQWLTTRNLVFRADPRRKCALIPRLLSSILCVTLRPVMVYFYPTRQSIRFVDKTYSQTVTKQSLSSSKFRPNFAPTLVKYNIPSADIIYQQNRPVMECRCKR